MASALDAARGLGRVSGDAASAAAASSAVRETAASAVAAADVRSASRTKNLAQMREWESKISADLAKSTPENAALRTEVESLTKRLKEDTTLSPRERSRLETQLTTAESKLSASNITKEQFEAQLKAVNADIDSRTMEQAWESIKNNKGTVMFGGAAVTGISLGIWAAIKKKESEDTPREIIKVEYLETGILSSKKTLKITYKPEIAITKKDTLTITGTKTTPPFDGSGISVTNVISDSSIVITTSQNTTNLQPGGTINVKTSTDNQIADALGSTLKGVGEAAGTAAGAAAGGVASGAGAALESFFSNTSFMAIAFIIIAIMLLK